MKWRYMKDSMYYTIYGTSSTTWHLFDRMVAEGKIRDIGGRGIGDSRVHVSFIFKQQGRQEDYKKLKKYYKDNMVGQVRLS